MNERNNRKVCRNQIFESVFEGIRPALAGFAFRVWGVSDRGINRLAPGQFPLPVHDVPGAFFVELNRRSTPIS
jgi:hypothetical protein